MPFVNRNVDDTRPIRVVIIGAGISGLVSCIRFKQRIPKLTLQIYEKNTDIGGTWLENRYPGCACDVPSHAYQATFEPNLNWSEYYASSPEIHSYWKHVANKYDCMKHIQFQHQVTEAAWDSTTSKWNLKVTDLLNNTSEQDSCDFLISCTGPLNDWSWPNIDGLHNFKGPLLHSAGWDENFDWKGKSIAVIGNGSSGIQIVASMLPDTARMDHYVRGKTWIAPTVGSGMIKKLGLEGEGNFKFSGKHTSMFKDDPQAYLDFRKELETELHSMYDVVMKDSPAQLGALEYFKQNMKKRLSNKPELAENMIPSFSPGCRRLTPGPGYLEALAHPKCNVIRTGIANVGEGGIFTTDGVYHPVDAIVCATGFNTKFVPRFPVIGKNGVLLGKKWAENPETYLSIATDEFPNYFVALGPNSNLIGSLLLLVEKEIDYFTACVSKAQREGIKNMTVKRSAVDGFTKYCDDFFAKTVFSEDCNSWYKGGTNTGRVIGLWPGSGLHVLEAFKQPRWEDFDYEYIEGNPIGGWLGNGHTKMETDQKIKIEYLDGQSLDVPNGQLLE